MKVLLDHNVPHKLRFLLLGHSIQTAENMGWATLSNGKLLLAAEEQGFEVMITADQNLSYQQNLKGRKLALIVLGTNNWHILRTIPAMIASALQEAIPGSFQRLDAP